MGGDAMSGGDADDRRVAVAIGHLGRDQVAMVELSMVGESIDHQIVSGYVLVPVDREAAARRIVAHVEAHGDRSAQWYDEPPTEEPKVAGMPLASRSNRLAGGIVDFVIIQTVTAIGAFAHASVLVLLLIDAAYWILGIAVTGRTIGKVLMGTRVLGRRGGRPSIVAAVVRYFVAAAGAWVAWAVGVELDSESGLEVAAAVLLALSPVVVYAPILRDGRRRGLHDMAAQTVVVRERRSSPR